jgi:hypothetical protein
MKRNVMTLFISISNYSELFGETTNHMILLMVFVMALVPQIIRPDTLEGGVRLLGSVHLLKGLCDLEGMTPEGFFTNFDTNPGVLPNYFGEVSKDLGDIVEFYNLSFAELRAGKARSDRIFRIREY